MKTTSPSPETPAADARVLAAARHLARADGEAVHLAQLGQAAGLSPFHVQRVFRRSTGLTPKECATGLRFARFRQHVRAGQSVTSAGYAAGFGSSRGLYEAARTGLGMTPARYARRGAGLAIAWRLGDCAFGRVLVAHTSDGVCAVLLGSDDAALTAQLRDEFSAAQLVPASSDTDAGALWTARVLQHLADSRLPLGVPLDLHGTPFELRVWRELLAIPAGETRRYGQIAAQLGAPGAARAVGGACARNVVAVLVPCHRVIAGDGRLSGYRWGPAFKARLLEAERD